MRLTEYGAPTLTYCTDMLNQKGASIETLMFTFFSTKYFLACHELCLDVEIGILMKRREPQISRSEFLRMCLVVRSTDL